MGSNIQSLNQSQKSQWFYSEANPDFSYCSLVYKFEGVNINQLQLAVTRLVLNQSSLRSRLIVVNNKIRCFIETTYAGADLFTLHSDDKNPEQRLDICLNRRFELNDIFSAISLIEIEANTYYFVVLAHPAILDRTSLGQIISILKQYYNDVNDDHTSVDASAYITAERNYLKSELHHQAIDYWVNSVRDNHYELSYLSNLGFTDSKAPNSNIALTSAQIEIPNSITDNQIELDRNIFLMLVLAVLLQRYTNNNQVVINYKFSDCYHIERDKVLGCFDNKLPFMIQIEQHDSLASLANKLHKQHQINQYYAACPYINVVRQVRDKLNSNFDGIFSNVLFDINEDGPETVEFNRHCKATLLTAYNRKTNLEAFCFNVVDKNNTLYLQLKHDAKVPNQFAQHLLENFVATMKHVLEQPNTQLQNIECLSPGIYQAVINTYNDNGSPAVLANSIQDAFLNQMDKKPSAVAIIDGKHPYTYLDIERASRIFAFTLLKQLAESNHKQQAIVLIALPKSVEFVIATLGTIRAGLTCAAIDPSYPEQRVQQILSNTGSRLIVTNQESIEINAFYSGLSAKPVLVNTQDLLTTSVNIDTNSLPKNNLTDLANIIYTSGTTGNPKGVMLSHRAILNFVGATSHQFSNSSVMGATAGVAFDATMFELWASLLQGKACAILPKHIATDPIEFVNIIHYAKIDSVFMTTALFNMLYAQDPDVFSQIKYVFIGGEQANENIVKNAAVRLTGTRIFNMYGPTEATICASIFPVKKETITAYNTIPVGKPIPGYAVYVLNRQQQALPPGAIGEIYISGVGLANGYLNLPEKTAESFLTNPFYASDTTGNATATMYKTGDLGSWLPDGNLRCLGRIDNQVKVRGFRIELDEVNVALSKISGVEKSIVLVEGEGDAKQLIAYVQSKLTEGKLLNKLSRSLPEYMIPSRINILAKIPLTENGKIDKNALSNRTSPLISSYTDDVNPYISGVMSAFSCILNYPAQQLELDSDFFSIGGHSLLAVQCIANIETQFGQRLSVQLFFHLRTIGSIADYLRIGGKPEKTADSLQLSKAPASYHKPSYAQGRMWYLHQFQDSQAYNIPGYVLFSGYIDLDILEQSFKQLSYRQHSLNTYFKLAKGRPLQHVDLSYQHKIEYIDVSSVDAMERNIVIYKQMKALEGMTFNVETLPLLKLVLIKSTEQQYYLLFNIHHLIFDGFSVNIMMQELGKLYQSNLSQKEDTLDPLRFNYIDYSYSQSKWVEQSSKSMESQLNFWREQIANVENLKLPYDYAKKEHSVGTAKQVKLVLDKEIFSGIEVLINEQKISLFSFLISIYAILLYKYTSQKQLTIGSLMANRQNTDVSKLIGCFVNTIFFNTRIDNAESFSEFVKKNHDLILQINENQDIPFDLIVRQRNSSNNSLFQTMMILQLGVELSGEWGDADWDMTLSKNKNAKFDLLVAGYKRGNSIDIIFEYNESVFKAERIEAMSGYFRYLIEQALDHYNNPLMDFDLLTPGERKDLLQHQQDNDSAKKNFSDETLLDLFNHAASKYATHVALQCRDQSITYAQLNHKVNNLALNILDYFEYNKLGTTFGQKICIQLPKGPDYIVAILAIIKLGSVYVPLDVKHPSDRTKFIIADCGAKLVIVSDDSSSQLDIHNTLNIANSERTASDTLLHKQLTEVTVHCFDYAYIIYTSGTTGKPKGVLITHRNAVRLFKTTQDQFNFTSNDIWTAFHSFAFDFSVWEIWGALLFGGTLLIIDDETARDLEAFYHLVSSEKVTIMNQTPGAFSNFISADKQFNLPLALRKVILGGEHLNFNTLKPWFDKHGDHHPALINMYGITEITVHATYYKISKADISKDNYSTIGKALHDLQLFVLDEDLKLSPPNVIGEIHVAGPGVSDGYLNRVELTREKFVANPFSHIPTSMLYKSGDLAIQREDGNILYVGRKDSQVKVRGYRIELGEIESCLAELPPIKQVVVVVDQQNNVGTRLVAYYTIIAGSLLDIESIKQHMSSTLPAYMLPDFYIELEEFTLTANGKIDKARLPKPDSHITSKIIVKPVNQQQREVLTIWSSLLEIPAEDISIDTSFFDLGGHSLLAANMLLEVNSVLKTKIDFMKFSAHPTIEMLTTNVDKKVLLSNLMTTVKVDMQLPGDIQYLHDKLKTDVKHINHVFLTGATGFLGFFMLCELIKQTDSVVYCLVRNKTEKNAVDRLHMTANKYRRYDQVDWQRVHVVTGDLELPQLGIPDDTWFDLSRRIDAIYHCGAYVHHIFDYDTLKASNVYSTIELLRLATADKNKAFHYISTLSSCSVFSDDGRALDVGPSMDVDAFNQFNGYLLSKYVSECLVWQAKERGVNVSIYRPGNVAGDTRFAVMEPSQNHLLLLVKSCLQLQCAPAWDFQFDVSPVDFMADVIVRSSMTDTNACVFHLSNPNSPSWKSFIHILQSLGGDIKLIDPAVWTEKLQHIGPDNALYPLLGYYLNREGGMAGSEMFVTSNTEHFLQSQCMQYPKIDRQLIELYVAFLVQTGFFQTLIKKR